MSALEDLITKAKALQAEGHTPGQISDELALDGDGHRLLTQPKGMEALKTSTSTDGGREPRGTAG